jgi:hypothetical protein
MERNRNSSGDRLACYDKVPAAPPCQPDLTHNENYVIFYTLTAQAQQVFDDACVRFYN